MPHREREQYNNFRRGTKNRTGAMTTPPPTMTHPNIANRFQHFSHSTNAVLSIHNRNSHFTSQTYQANQIRGHIYNNAPFRITNTS